MIHDPIVDDVRQARQKILAACGDDLEKLLDRLKAAEAQYGARVVSMKSLRQKLQHQRVEARPNATK